MSKSRAFITRTCIFDNLGGVIYWLTKKQTQQTELKWASFLGLPTVFGRSARSPHM
jgi:hypothetical protein